MCSVVLPTVLLRLFNFIFVLIVVYVHWRCQESGSLPSIISTRNQADFCPYPKRPSSCGVRTRFHVFNSLPVCLI